MNQKSLIEEKLTDVKELTFWDRRYLKKLLSGKNKKELKPQNQMTIEECKMAFPKSKWFQPSESPSNKAEIPEDLLQDYANQAITLRGWTFIRFHNKLLGWIKRNPSVPEWVRRCFFSQVAGRLPDNLIMVQIAPSTFLAVKLELKTQDKKGRAVGRLHGKQKNYAETEGWYIARSPEQINIVLDKTGSLAELLKRTIGTENIQPQPKVVSMGLKTIWHDNSPEDSELPPFDPVQIISELTDTKIAIESNFNQVALQNIDEIIRILEKVK